MVLAMLLVGLLISAGYAVLTRRRIRHYGLLAAIGATERNVRGAAIFNGVVLGALATGIGAILGIGAAAAVVPLLEEEAIGHRISFELPWLIIAPTIAMGVAVSAIAAWWPMRAVARQPVVEALAARRPAERPVRAKTGIGVISTVSAMRC